MALAQGEQKQQPGQLFSGKLESDLIVFDKMHGQARYYDEFKSLPANLQKELSNYHQELLKSGQSPGAAAFWVANFLDRESGGQSPLYYYQLTSSQMLSLTRLAWDLVPSDVSETIAARQAKKKEESESGFLATFIPKSENISKMSFAESSQVFDERHGRGDGAATMRWLLTSLHNARNATGQEKHGQIAWRASGILPKSLLDMIYEKKTENVFN